MSDFIQDSEFPYIPPCMRCQPIIEYANIQFHKQSIPYELEIFQDSDYRFGVFDIAVRGEIPITQKHIHIFFTIDASGSMNDKCLDGRTKMQHILYTLENILRIFHEKPECHISIQVQSFDSTIYKIIQDIDNIQDNDIESIIFKINKIRPGNSTNIELALQSAKDEIYIYKNKNPEHEVVHLFLTDGEITSGSDDNDLLKSIVPKNCTNIFIGYGLDHDSQLLSILSSESSNEYRFIDALEKAGLVYGEIIHSILYKAIADITIKAIGCELYEYKTNTWIPELKIGNLISEQKKTYHIRSKMPTEGIISVQGRTIIKTRQFQIMTNDIEEQVSTGSLSKIFEIDLTKYMFRQRTQELLYEAIYISEKNKDKTSLKSPPILRSPAKLIDINNNDKKKQMKIKLKIFLNLMLDYMKKNDMESDSFMKMLCDDIYITYKTFDTSVGNMFLCARQTTQGRQQSYTAATFSSQEEKCDDFQIPDVLQIPDDFNIDELPLLPPAFGMRRQLALTDSDDDINYTFTQTFLSPYSSSGVVATMRKVSGNHTFETILDSAETDIIH